MSSLTLRLIFFNDCYEIEQGKREPVGGVSRMTGAIRQLQSEGTPSLVLFGGDVFSPSTMSIFDKGRAMVSVLNAIGVDAAVVGNHDLDFGEATLSRWIELTPTTAWLLSNIVDPITGAPLAGAKKSALLERGGVKVGVFGLGEFEWTTVLSQPTPLRYHDMVQVGDQLSAELRAAGADVIVCLCHVRLPNLELLAEKLADVDAVLAGHDHVLHKKLVNKRPTMVADNEFKAVGVVDLTLGADRRVASVAALRHVVVDSSVPEDPAMVALVGSILEASKAKLSKRIGWCSVPLDCTTRSCRSGESNFGNWVADLCRINCAADVVLFNGGTIRSDSILAPGPFTIGDLLRVLPFVDPVVVISVTGAQLLEALEAGVSKFPTLDGCWPQISGMRVVVDPTKPPGSRLVSVRLTQPDREVVRDQHYRLATKSFIANGADGYDCLRGSRFIVDEEAAQLLKNHIRHHFRQLDVLNGWKRITFAKHSSGVSHAIERFKQHGLRKRSRKSPTSSASAPAPAAVAAAATHDDHDTHHQLCRNDLGSKEFPLLSICPVVDGRIRVLDELGALATEFETKSRDDLLREILHLRHQLDSSVRK
jgi:5'-nucleotidase